MRTYKPKPWHITTLPRCKLRARLLRWCIHTMTFPPTHAATELSVSFIHSSHPGSHCVSAWSVKRRNEIRVLRHFPDFTPAPCFLVHPSSLTQCIWGEYRWLPLWHSHSHVTAIRAISLSSITCLCKHDQSVLQAYNPITEQCHLESTHGLTIEQLKCSAGNRSLNAGPPLS